MVEPDKKPVLDKKTTDLLGLIFEKMPHRIELLLFTDPDRNEPYSAAIREGYSPAVELARRTGVELTEDGYIKKDSRHRTNIPGIYSAGDVEGGYKQIVIAAGQGSEAALAVFEDLVNPYWVSQPGVLGQLTAPSTEGIGNMLKKNELRRRLGGDLR